MGSISGRPRGLAGGGGRFAVGLMAWCGVVLTGGIRGPALAADAETDLAIRTWSVEQFGSDVAILRGDGAAAGRDARAAGFLLSCSGPDRRFRLSLPGAISDGEAGGSALITVADRRDRSRAIVRFKLSDASTILVSAGAPQRRDIASALGRMLLAKPHALDMLLSLGSRPVSFTKLKLVRVLLTLGPEDVEAVTRFVDACSRYPAARND